MKLSCSGASVALAVSLMRADLLYAIGVGGGGVCALT